MIKRRWLGLMAAAAASAGACSNLLGDLQVGQVGGGGSSSSSSASSSEGSTRSSSSGPTSSSSGTIHSCVGQPLNYTYCDPNDVLRTCDNPDGVTASSFSCVGKCSSGACQAPICGDGKIDATGEVCDDGNTTPLDGCEPTCVKSAVLDLAAGTGHTCALLAGGYVRCWGGNDNNELGLGNTNPQANNLPYALTNLNGKVAPPLELGGAATAIAVGGNHTCALLQDQTIRCWGANDAGQLGLGNNAASVAGAGSNGAVNVGGAVISLAAGGTNTCGVLADGSVKCWGDNSYGQLGQGSTTDFSATKPKDIPAIDLGETATSVAVGLGTACAILTSGNVRCWGNNNVGQAGLGTNAAPKLTSIGDDEAPSSVGPVAFAVDRTAKSVKIGSSHVCALLDDGSVNCWGYNGQGQLGNGSTADIGDNEAVFPAGFVMLNEVGGVATAIALGARFTCAIVVDRGLVCWGSNNEAQLGYPDMTNTLDTTPNNLGPVLLPAGTTPVKVGLGATHACVLLSNGAVRCWGRNDYGQLGLGKASKNPDYIGGDGTHTPNLLSDTVVFKGP